MKRFPAIILVFICLSGLAQTMISSYPLSVCCQKTTNILFPYRILTADIGSADVIGHKDPGLPNVLFLKANRKGFAPTNLSVYTSDGKFYSFIVQYKENPDSLNVYFSKEDKFSLQEKLFLQERSNQHEKLNLVFSDSVNDARLDSDAVLIQNQNPFIHQRAFSQQMKAVVRGIYIRDCLMWFKMEIFNHSEVDYQPEYFRFYIKDTHTGKRTAMQEQELAPLWQTPNKSIHGREKITCLFAFPAFTLSRQKKFSIQISEQHGARDLTIVVRPKTIIRAKVAAK